MYGAFHIVVIPALIGMAIGWSRGRSRSAHFWASVGLLAIHLVTIVSGSIHEEVYGSSTTLPQAKPWLLLAAVSMLTALAMSAVLSIWEVVIGILGLVRTRGDRSEQHLGQVSSEAAPSAAPNEPSR